MISKIAPTLMYIVCLLPSPASFRPALPSPASDKPHTIVCSQVSGVQVTEDERTDSGANSAARADPARAVGDREECAGFLLDRHDP